MKKGLLIFPHQLFEVNFYLGELDTDTTVFLIEEKLFFEQYKFHKQKLILHRASLKAYETELHKKNFKTKYIDFKSKLPDLDHAYIAHPSDDWLEQKLTKKYSKITWLKTKYFLQATPFKKQKSYFMANFYKHQRRSLNILIDKSSNTSSQSPQPTGGKWSFDSDNRKKLPKNHQLPEINWPERSPHNKQLIQEATEYVSKNFPDNYGAPSPFNYPIDRQEAQQFLKDFLKHRFENFGTYEDAITQKDHFLYHTVLSSSINLGLLTPQEVVDEILTTANSKKDNIPLNSTEGLIRQIIGWREFIHEVYKIEGRRQRTSNFFNFSRSIPKSFWTGDTGILPFDETIKKTLKTGYCHHIERLMILANFMVLCEITPDEIYEWFMTLFIDAYDWVMVPNVYGMATYSDGGLMTTKPYISSSNYIRKMSDYPKGEWCEIWDGLYWRFIHKHQEFFSKNPRLSVMTLALKRMSEEKLKGHLEAAEGFLKSIQT